MDQVIYGKISFDAEISIKETTENDYPLLYKAALNASNKYTRLIGKVAAWQIRNSLTQRKLYLFLKGKGPVGYSSFKFEKKMP